MKAWEFVEFFVYLMKGAASGFQELGGIHEMSEVRDEFRREQREVGERTGGRELRCVARRWKFSGHEDTPGVS
jgi:hypothetical protein